MQRKKIKERVKRHRLNGNKEPRERIKERVKEHREKNGLSKNHKETSKEAMERYRERWGWNNKNEQLGSGRLSKKRNEDFEIEEKIIKWEKRRLGIKEV